MKRLLVLTAALLAGAASIAAAPAHPDLTGVWMINNAPTTLKTVEGQEPPLTPAGKAIYEANKAKTAKGDRSWDGLSYCLPPGLPRLMLVNKPFEILQRPKTVFFVHQENRLPRRVYMDEKIPDDIDSFYLGYSVGKWEGPELVVESKGFREGDTFIDMSGLPHSKDLQLTERYRLSADGKTLTARFTITDPKDYTRPWTAQATYSKRIGYQIPEEVCAERLKTTSPTVRGKAQ
jgi:hypothetical protein